MRVTLIAGIALAAIVALLFGLNYAFPSVLTNPDNRLRVFGTVGWLLLMVASVAIRSRNSAATALRSLAAWLLIGVALVWIYAYRFEAQAIGYRILGELLPSHPIDMAEQNGPDGSGAETAIRQVRLTRNVEGHYQIDARVNGTYITFLVDTGATDVVLSPADARRIGFSEGQLNFSERAETANGTVYVAPVILNNLTIGSIIVNGLPAKVDKAPMEYSLLGMRFLNQLHGWRVEQQTLILEQ